MGKGSSVLAFLFYGKIGAAEKELNNFPTIIWLNGGPGSSSQLGNFEEIGPLRFKRQLSPEIEANPYTWAKDYNLVFVDQPVGTGLSLAEKKEHFVSSMDGNSSPSIEMANDFYYALDQLYNNKSGCFHSEHLGISPNSSLFLFGESYGGKYAPAIGKKIIEEKLHNRGFLKGLKGVGIGDGFTAPFDILSEVGMFASYLSLIDYQERGAVEKRLLFAHRNSKNKEWSELHHDFDHVLNYIVERAGGVNIYDIKEDGLYPKLLDAYFADNENIKTYALEEDIVFDSQSHDVFQGLWEDFMKDETSRVEYLLAQEIPVLIYNGQDDLIVTVAGTMRWVDRINYEFSNAFAEANLLPWRGESETFGSRKSAGHLHLYVVNNAGHLVPKDCPKAAQDMAKTFISQYK